MKQMYILILVFVVLISTSAITIAANENMNILPESSGGSSGGGILNPDDILSTDQSIYSQDGRYKLTMQGDGNLVFYDSAGMKVWDTGTSGSNFWAIMQKDGNFVVYDKNNNWQFATQTWDSPGARLIIQNDGTIALYDTNNNKLWWAPRKNPIDKQENLGKFDGVHRYYIHIYNVDDIARTYINGKLFTETKYQQDRWIDITNNLSDGENKIEFNLDNGPVGWTYGFEIRQDDSNIIWNDKCGQVDSGSGASIGCLNGDLTRGLVYRAILTLTIEAPQQTGYSAIFGDFSEVVNLNKDPNIGFPGAGFGSYNYSFDLQEDAIVSVLITGDLFMYDSGWQNNNFPDETVEMVITMDQPGGPDWSYQFREGPFSISDIGPLKKGHHTVYLNVYGGTLGNTYPNADVGLYTVATTITANQNGQVSGGYHWG